MSKRPTIQMVADHAGVSRGTVDRVINNRSYVKDTVRTRVLEAIQAVGYLPPRTLHHLTLSDSDYMPLRLGVLLPNWTGHFKSEITRGIEAARAELQEFGIQVAVRECRTEVPAETLELLDELLQEEVKGIAICAVNDFLIEQKIDWLADQGIPVITFNSDLPNSRRLGFIGQDYDKSGRIAGELMSKCVSPHALILAMAGNLEFYGHRKRLEGFCTRMRELGFQNEQLIVAETYNDYMMTYRRVQDTLTRNPHLDAVYMANRSVVGCAEAIKALGKTGLIRVIAHDVSETTKRLLRQGNIDFTISQDLFGQGYHPLILLRDLLQKGKPVSPEQTSSPISIICSENLDL